MNVNSKSLKWLFVCLLYVTKAFSSGHPQHHVDPLTKNFISNPRQLPNQEYQQELTNQAFWQNYQAQHKTWKVIFNEQSAMPHRAFGTPISVPGFDAKSTAENFIADQLREFQIPFSELQFRSASTNEKYHYVNYLQYFQGLEVLFANVQVRMTHDYRVNQFALDCYKNIPLNITPSINQTSAIQFASNNVAGIQQVTVSPDLKVLPIPGNRSYKFYLVYEMVVENMDDDGIPGQYYTLVDASNGDILYRANKVSHFANTDVNVSGTLYVTNLYSPSTVEPMKNMRIVQGSNVFFTDDTGYIGFPNTTSSIITASLQGRWVKIRTNSVTPSWTVTLNPGANNLNIDANGTDIKQRTTYNAINTVHDYMKTKYPAFTGLDFPLPANIDVSGTCNAFYNGSSVNFFDEGGGCNATSLVSDVGFHEYGHGINDKFYQSQGFSFSNGSMGEGYADLWALGITASPILGVGFFDSNLSGIRRYDIGKKVYPQDLIGEVHADGEIIAGCFWDTYLNLGNLQQMMDLFKETYYAGITGPNGTEGTLYPDILLETLAQDDNDGDLSNGTPNYCPIVAAFAIHGIDLGTVLIACVPTANFTFEPGFACEGSNFTFTDASFFADTWNWSFPGGTPSTSNDQNPVVNYPAAGVYDVTLSVNNGAGTDMETKTGIITILPGIGQNAIPFYESFEAIAFPGTEWGIENGGGNTWQQNTIAAKTGSNSVYINNFSGNPASASDVFITPSYNLIGSVSNVMTFELAYANRDSVSNDRLKVFASTTCGQLWNIRYTKFGSNLATSGIVTGSYVPGPGDWETQSVNISSVSYNNQPNVRFKFEYSHDSGNDIFIDDINISGTVGMSELDESAFDFNVYPNPVSSSATISFIMGEPGDVLIDVVDVLGREVNTIAETRLDAGEYQFELPADLANGLYNVRIIVDGSVLSRKVLINR